MLREHGVVRNFETLAGTKSGETVPVLVSAAPIDIGGDSCLVAIVADIGDLKRAHEKIRHLNESLEDRVRQRTSELEFANSENGSICLFRIARSAGPAARPRRLRIAPAGGLRFPT